MNHAWKYILVGLSAVFAWNACGDEAMTVEKNIVCIKSLCNSHKCTRTITGPESACLLKLNLKLDDNKLGESIRDCLDKAGAQ